MKRNQAMLLLLLTTIIWGMGVVAQIAGMDYIHPFALNFHRSLAAGFFLLIVLLFIPKLRDVGTDLKATIKGGVLCGICLSVAMALQQYGFQYTTASKGGFITALYIVLVPIGGVLMHRPVSKKTWVAVVVAAVGLYFISVKKGAGLSMGMGDFLVFLSAIAFSVHILVIDCFADKVDGVAMSCIQFFTASVFSLFFVLLTGASIVGDYVKALPAILYLGILSSGVGFTLQIMGQRYTDPTTASLILSLESVFSLLGGIALLGESVTVREGLGCMLLFVAILIAQLPMPKIRKLSAKE
ncbi:MAG: DMT family transporter [Peptoniphilus sp.]|nr:DMT family transporter [Peptoniphilus sp.]MDY3118275.1 DMT family transporter [Peptoniphilus sp.]